MRSARRAVNEQCSTVPTIRCAAKRENDDKVHGSPFCFVLSTDSLKPARVNRQRTRGRQRAEKSGKGRALLYCIEWKSNVTSTLMTRFAEARSELARLSSDSGRDRGRDRGKRRK